MCKKNEPLKRKMGKAGRCDPPYIGCCRIVPLRAVKASAGVLLELLCVCVWGCGVVFLNWFLVLHSSLPPSRAPPVPLLALLALLALLTHTGCEMQARARKATADLTCTHNSDLKH